jgi:VWFA-related protein
MERFARVLATWFAILILMLEPGCGKVSLGQSAEPRPLDSGAPSATQGDVQVIVRQVDESAFPEITLDFEVRKPDGTSIPDATKDEFRVTENDEPVAVLGFQAPIERISRPTTVVLVVDRSKSMEDEDRIGGLKRSVASFLETMPAGSKVAVISFGQQVILACPFTTDIREVQQAVDRLFPMGGTRFYDAVDEAIRLLADEPGRKAILALTDGEDTISQEADLASVIRAAQRVGLPVHTLGLGSEDEIASEELRLLAEGSRGQYFAARDSEQLGAIYEEIAQRLGQTYSLSYRTDRSLPDGTLRPVKLYFRESEKASGQADVFISGMVVPGPAWPGLFLVLLATLAAIGLAPRLRRKPAA